MSLQPLIDEIIDRNDFSEKRVGIMLSGGLDSGVLFFHLAKKVGPRLMAFTVPRSENSMGHALRVSKAVCERLKYPTIEPVAAGNPEMHHSQQVASGVERVFEADLADVVFLADNIVPSELVLRDDPWAPERIRVSIDGIFQPFFDLTKDKIVAAAFTDRLEFILAESHTCTERSEGRCNQCWQCRERAWAFEKAGRPDPGVR